MLFGKLQQSKFVKNTFVDSLTTPGKIYYGGLFFQVTTSSDFYGQLKSWLTACLIGIYKQKMH